MKVNSLRALADIIEFRTKAIREELKVVVLVGYTAAYALYVHENLEMAWRGLPRGSGFAREDGIVYYGVDMGAGASGKGFYWDPQGRGQSKFLEQPARILSRDGTFTRMMVEALRKKKTVAQALLLVGLRLQRESQRLVPIDTGNLRASAFTRMEKR